MPPWALVSITVGLCLWGAAYFLVKRAEAHRKIAQVFFWTGCALLSLGMLTGAALRFFGGWEKVQEYAASPTSFPTLPASVSAEERARLERAWPKMLRACPGLAKYYDSLLLKGVTMAFMDEDGFTHTTMTFVRKEGESRIPKEYRVFGHTCFFGVSRDGNWLVVPKSPCQSLCLDVQRPPGDPDFRIPLK